MEGADKTGPYRDDSIPRRQRKGQHRVFGDHRLFPIDEQLGERPCCRRWEVNNIGTLGLIGKKQLSLV